MVRVVAHNDEVSRLVKNRVLQVDHGDSAAISTRVLKATDSDDADNNIFFIVQRTPEKGSLEVRDTVRVGGTSQDVQRYEPVPPLNARSISVVLSIQVFSI